MTVVIHCYVAMCLIASPAVCDRKVEIEPQGHIVVSPMECGRGGLIYYSQFNMAREEIGTPTKFPRVWGEMDGDGSDIVQTWLADQRAKRAAARPQIR